MVRRVQNIYYMLSYAFRILTEDSFKRLAAEEFDYAADLFAAILSLGMASQIKRGLHHQYQAESDVRTSPVGKINISESIRRQTLLKKQLVCTFDEFTENTYLNQILKATAMLLLKSPEVDASRKRKLKKVLLYFAGVDDIKPAAIQWSHIKFHRNNATYRMLIHICYLVIAGMLQTEKNGRYALQQYIDDQRMHRLYERFILAYYQKHYPDLSPKASHIMWNLESCDENSAIYLPEMKSDIMLASPEHTVIIDAKYYGRSMQSNPLYDSRSLHSGNLYQIYAYVKNYDVNRRGNVSGILLYAKTDEEITPDCEYMMDGNRIAAKTLDLDANFRGISQQLDKLVVNYFGSSCSKVEGWN